MSAPTLATSIANGMFLALVGGIPLYAYIRKVDLVPTFIDGAKEGFEMTVRLLPFFVGMIVAIGMLRASGFFTSLSQWLGPLLDKIGMPTDILPLALLRPFSGGGSNAMLVDIIHQHGADSLTARIAATLIGSTETTFYVLAIYFGSVAIKRTRHAVVAGLLADVTAVIAAIVFCRILFVTA